MRRIILAVAAVLVSAAPAEAKWQYFSCQSDNFATEFPAAPRAQKIKFSMTIAKEALSARSYTAILNNIVYKMVVADYSDRIPTSASILAEAMAFITDADPAAVRRAQESGKERVSNGKVIANDSARVGDETYGRRITMDLSNNGGRATTTLFFFDGKLYEQSATILPANGDYDTPYATRFVESLIFNFGQTTNEREKDVGKVANIQGCG